MRPSVPTRRRHLRVRPYIDHPLTCYWRCPIEGCHFAAVNPVEHPCPLVPPPDHQQSSASEAETQVPQSLLARVHDGLRGLGTAPAPSSGREEPTPLVRVLEASPEITDDVAATGALPVVGVGA